MLPSSLTEAVRDRSAILFLGAGASFDAIHPSSAKAPSGADLRDEICDKFLSGRMKDRNLSEVSEYAISETDLLTVQRFIRDRFLALQPAEFHNIIPLYPWRAIFTTNYDLIVERAYQNLANRPHEPVQFVKNDQKIDKELRRVANSFPLIKLHGCIDSYADRDIPFILSTEQYAKFSTNRTRLFSYLLDLGREYSLIFYGYSILDPHIVQIMHELFDLGGIRPQYYIVKKSFDQIEERYWSSKRVTTVSMTFSNFLNALREELDPALATAGAALSRGRHPISRHYKTQMVESGDLRSFLEIDVEYVTNSMLVSAATAADFYAGFDPGFASVIAGYDVRRSLTDTILTTAVLQTNDTPTTQLYTIKGPAGFGKTVQLKRIAWEAATEFDALVLFHRPGGSLRLSPIEELCSNTGRRIFLFIDRAALNVEDMYELYSQAKAKSIALTIVTAERDNEWGVRCERLDEIVREVFEIQRFSRRDIENLVRKLDAHRELGILKGLSFERQVAEFEVRADRQILVMLYELTKGIPFEDIIMNEFERIIPNEAQGLYLDICCLNRLGVPVRAGLVSRATGVEFAEFRSRLLAPLDKIVHAYRDDYSDMMYVARHSTIAQIVFERALSDQNKRYDTIIRLLQAMNISYSSDYEAFRRLTNGREVAALFASQDLGRNLYSIAFVIAGEDAHLYQQRAIFELRHAGGDKKEALRCVNKAVVLRPGDRSIEHSKATVLRAVANQDRNSLSRAETRREAKDILKYLAGRDATQAHGFHTLSLLILDEIKEIKESLDEADPEKSGPIERVFLDRVADLQSVIRDGLSKFGQEPRLLTVESEYHSLVSRSDRALRSLKRAFQVNPRLDWIATRLARMLVTDRNHPEAKDTLRAALVANPSSKEANFELGVLLATSMDGAERGAARDYLRRGFTEGDTNHVARAWYARDLFLSGASDKALEIFAALSDLSLPVDVKRRSFGTVFDETTDIPKLFSGTIVRVEEGFLFVSVPEFGKDIFSPYTAVVDKGVMLRSGMLVEVNLAFSYRGPLITLLRMR